MGDLLRLPDRNPDKPSPAPDRGPAEPLWRELVGRELRAERQERGERLSDVA